MKMADIFYQRNKITTKPAMKIMMIIIMMIMMMMMMIIIINVI